MKAILVIDIPDGADTKDIKIGGDGNIYINRKGDRSSIIGNIRNIKPMPEKNTWDITKNGHVTEYAEGYNACIDEILGETE